MQYTYLCSLELAVTVSLQDYSPYAIFMSILFVNEFEINDYKVVERGLADQPLWLIWS